MLEKTDLEDHRLVTCLNEEYGVLGARISFLPFGADRNAAAYRVVAGDGTRYFLKLRAGDFDETCVLLLKFLSDQGIDQIAAPLSTTRGELWASLDAFKVILSPFIEGRNAYEAVLQDRHWRELGIALKRVHSAVLPPALLRRIRTETYTPRWRKLARASLNRAQDSSSDDPLAVRLCAFLRSERDLILDLIARAGRLGQALQAQPAEMVLCHSDLHAGNVLIDTNQALYVVDWDDPILAPKERDLMFIGGAQGFAGRTAQEEEILFYQGYGQVQIDPLALAYYRYERIVQDIALFCEQILLNGEGGEDREQAFRYLASNFLPNGTIDAAYRSDGTWKAG
jgi:spectinomycin phosphotransferase